MFGTSRHVVVAGTSASAVLVFSAVNALHPKDAGKYAALAAGVIGSVGFVLVRRVLGLLGIGPAPDAKDVEIAVLGGRRDQERRPPLRGNSLANTANTSRSDGVYLSRRT